MIKQWLNVINYPEESASWSRLQAPIFNLGLLSEVLGGLYRWLHPLHREEGCQVGGVGADHDQGEEPPHGGDHPGGDGLGREVTSLLHQGPHGEPHGVAQGELIDQDLLLIAWVGVVPLIRTKSIKVYFEQYFSQFGMLNSPGCYQIIDLTKRNHDNHVFLEEFFIITKIDGRGI